MMTETSELELELVVVEKSEHEKIDELYKDLVESNFSEKLIKYFELSKRQDKVLKRIKDRKSNQK